MKRAITMLASAIDQIVLFSSDLFSQSKLRFRMHLICLYKIMEGIFGSLRKKARAEAKRIGLDLSWPKELVPNHPHIATHLRYLIGKPIKEIYDTVLQKEYRDNVSHFLVRENVILRVSSAAERFKFAEMTFLSDLCVRVLISNHEQALHKLADAEAIQPRQQKP